TWTLLYTRRLLPLLLRTVVTGLLVPVIVDILWGCSKYRAEQPKSSAVSGRTPHQHGVVWRNRPSLHPSQ
ncbi:hypothetical protein, partial [Faecalibacterium sp. An192]|uniref:hypothetical protein n=1 Tax=Faecalibacterium sp. An192 TaxID=1965581 RepID=UPI0019D082CF